MPLSIPIFVPLAAGLVSAFLPRGWARWLVLGAAVFVLGFAIGAMGDYPSGGQGLTHVTDTKWIPELGIRYSLGIDGLNLFLIALTAVVWVAALLAASLREWDRPRLFFFHMALAETAVLGAFCAQDLILFVFFFDLMLIPFYFLIGGWGGRQRVAATTKLVIYTLVGSLLMLAGAIALGVLATPDGGHISFSLATLQQRTLGLGTQEWIFLLFAAAFLVKAPAFPLHGWMPDGYRAAPLEVLIPFSAVLSKVGMYGLLRIVLPIMPQAAHHYQELLIAIAVVSILYGSVLAFTQDDARLVVGYSSVAQLGFILLGIFALDLQGKGAEGALLQMVNHGLVVAPLFLIIGALSARTRSGTELLSRMGGMATRAPVLAALFLVVSLATLAMPGSSNFAGELLILFGAFSTKIAFGLVASAGVALAAVYMIRLYQRAMHNREGPEVESRELTLGELTPIAALVAVVVALGVYPNFVARRSEASTTASSKPAALVAHQSKVAVR